MTQLTALRSLFLALALLIAGVSSPALANRAETMLIPTRIVIDKGDRYATLVLKNTGNATGQYEITTVDMRMNEDGSIVEIPEGETPDFPATPLVHVAPRSVTVASGASQTIRILVRQPEGIEAGEYRSHIKVRVVNDNVEAGGAAKPEQGSIEVRANLVLVIPLILRVGETSFKASLSDPQLRTAPEGGSRFIEVYLNREGNRSSMGDFKVLQNRNGALVEVASLDGVPVYRPTARRVVNIPLTGPLGTGPLTIRYQQQESEGSAVLAETTLNP